MNKRKKRKPDLQKDKRDVLKDKPGEARDKPARFLSEQWWNRPEEAMEVSPLLDHLQALRKTLLFSIIAITVSVVLTFFLLSDKLLKWILKPLGDEDITVIFTDVAEGFSSQMKLAVIGGIVLASPLVFIALWLFIRPALHRKERATALVYMIMATILFAAGIFFAYRYVFFLAVHFFIQAGNGFARPMLSLGTYVNFLFGFLPPFGLMFELPVLIIWLTRLGLVTTEQLRKTRKYVILALFTISALLTPPDVISQLMLGMPLLLLYEASILCSILAAPGRKKAAGGHGKG